MELLRRLEEMTRYAPDGDGTNGGTFAQAETQEAQTSDWYNDNEGFGAAGAMPSGYLENPGAYATGTNISEGNYKG